MTNSLLDIVFLVTAAAWRRRFLILVPRVVALEVETARPQQDYRRRKKIAAGNVQQVVRLEELFRSRYGGTEFAFASDKALRSVVPFVLLLIFFIPPFLAEASPIFGIMFLAQVPFYLIAFLPDAFPEGRFPQPVGAIQYLVKGNLAGLIGASRYVLGLERATWRSAPAPSSVELRTMRRFNEYLARLGRGTRQEETGPGLRAKGR